MADDMNSKKGDVGSNGEGKTEREASKGDTGGIANGDSEPNLEADDAQQKPKEKKKTVTIGSVTDIQADFSKTKKSSTVNENFLLSAGTSELLPKKGPKPILQNADACDTTDNAPPKVPDMGDDDDDDMADDSTKPPPIVGSVKSIAQSDMANISQTFNRNKPSQSTVDKNFLFLRAGADALLPKKGPKKKRLPEDSRKNAEKKVEDDKSSEISDDTDTKFATSKPKSVVYDEYYCKVCDVPLNSEATYLSHIEGKKHQKKLESRESSRSSRRNEDLQYVKGEEGCRINRIEKLNGTPHIQSQLECLNDACVGLNFVSEIWRLDRTTDDAYYCSLCIKTCQPNTIISHIIGYKHRFAYMRMSDPVSYEAVKNMSAKKSELTALLQQHAESYERIHGPGIMKIEIEVEGYVHPLEAGVVYNAQRHESPPPFLSLGDDGLFKSPFVRLKCIEEAGANLDVSEIVSRDQISIIQHSIENLRKSLSRYTIKDPMLQRRIFRYLQNNGAQRMGIPPENMHMQYPGQPASPFPTPRPPVMSGYWGPAEPSFKSGRSDMMDQHPFSRRSSSKRTFSARDN